MKKWNKVEGATTNKSTITTTPPVMSPLAKIFHELSLENKHAYFMDRYGTVKWTTGFFDYRFKQDIKDTKTFTQEDGTIIDACITLWGWNFERGAGGDSSNWIVVYIGDKAFSTGSVKYHEVTYYSGWSKKENYTASDDYQEILDCIYDPVKSVCTVMVKTGNKASRPIVIERSGKIKRDEKLLGKLYIPSSISGQKTSKDLSETLELETSEAEKYKSATESRSKTDMYKEAFDIYVMNGNYNKALSILTENKISVSKISPSKVLSLVETHLDQCNSNGSYGSSETFYKYEELVDRVSNKEMKKKLATTIVNAMLKSEKWGYKSMISLYMKLADIMDWGTHTLYQTYFDKNVSAFDLEDEKTREILDLLSQGKKENYQRLYDAFIEKGWLRKFIWRYIDSYIPELNTTLQAYFESKGIKNIDLFSTSYKVEKQKQYVIVAAMNLISKWLVTPEKVKNVLSEVMPKDIYEVLEYKDIDRDKRIETVKSLNVYLWVEFSDELVHFLSDRLNARSWSDSKNAAEELLAFFDENGLTQRTIQAAIEKWHVRALESFDKKWLLLQREQVIGYGKACYTKGRHDKMKAVFEKFTFTPEEQESCIDVSHAEISIKEEHDDLTRLPYISHTKAVKLIESYSDENRKSFCHYREEYVNEKIADHLSVLLSREDISSEYINNTLTTCYENNQRVSLKRLLMSWSIKIDKTLINKRIWEQIELWDLEYAKKIAKLWGLISIRGKKIAILEINSWTLGTRDMESKVKENKLSKEYYSYLINSHLASNDIETALKLSEEKDVIITKDQFDAYRARIEKKNKQA